MTISDVAVRTNALVKSFQSPGQPKTEVIRCVDFSMARGAFETVMGPSGSGKSTFLHLLSGLLIPDSGTAEIGGMKISCMSDSQRAICRRRHVGLIFQDYNLLPTLTAEENAMLPLLLDKKMDASDVRKTMEELGIAGLAAKMPAELSGGERQRVAIVRALSTKPDVILADEPTGNLDSPAAHEFCTLLKRINTETGTTVLVVTHDPVVAAYSTRVHLLKDGRFTGCFNTDGNPKFVSEQYLAAMTSDGGAE